jgi:1-acyl-sn-glycerol-3-phosphate acyltransferase
MVMVWPPVPKGIILIYPHTSNWDFIVGILYRYGWGLPAHWVGKHTLFRRPFAGLLAHLGGIPVNRDVPGGLFKALLAQFRERESMWLAIAPEGTRSHKDHVKSGFYKLALAANVPLALGFIDYGTRTVGIDTYLTLTGDQEADLGRIRDFYATKRGHRPELASDIRFRRE